MAIVRRAVRLVIILLTGIPINTYVSITALLRPKDARARYRARWQQLGCKWLCTVLGLRASFEGEPIPNGPGMVVSNHFGGLEPLVLASQMPVAFVAKAEMASWPLIGWITRTMGVIFVERGRADRKGHFLEQVDERLRDGVMVLAFPEGTTTEGDRLLPFKTGVFEAVRGKEQASVFPCYTMLKEISGRPADIEDQRAASWAGGTKNFLSYAWHLLGLKRAVLSVRFGPPIRPDHMDRKQLAKRARKAVLQLSEG